MIDCIVVGGGPAGLSAAVNLCQRGREVLVLSAGPSILAKAELVDNCIGLPQMDGSAMLETLKAHALAKGARIEHKKVSSILPFGESFMLNADGEILECRSVILACGTARATAIPGEDEYLGRGVSYCATCDGMLYRGRKVVVVGRTKDAPEEANFLHQIGCRVTYVSPQPPHGLQKDIPYRKAGRVEILGQERVTGLVLDGEQVACDGVFVLRSAVAPADLVSGLAVEQGSILVDRRMATNVPGVFAAGDCTGQPYQVAKAVGEGLVAGESAAEYLDKL